MPSEQERNYGRFLTDTQRDYLRGYHDPPNQNAEKQLRSKIRDRTVGAILDLHIVSRNLTEQDRELVFNYKQSQIGSHRFEEAAHNVWGYLGLVEVFRDITRFFYKLLRENGVSRAEAVTHLEKIAEKGEHETIHGFEWQEGWVDEGRRAVDVEADFRLKTLENIDVERVREKFERGTEISGLEMKALVESDEAELQLDG